MRNVHGLLRLALTVFNLLLLPTLTGLSCIFDMAGAMAEVAVGAVDPDEPSKQQFIPIPKFSISGQAKDGYRAQSEHSVADFKGTENGGSNLKSGPVLNAAMMKKIYYAASLSVEVYSSTPTDKDDAFDEFKAFTGGKTRAIFARADETCYGIFMGADELNDFFSVLQDMLNLFDRWKTFDNGCKTGEGIAEYYESFTNTDGLVETIKECIASNCESSNDCLILGGHSLGGAIALTAAVSDDLAAHKPYVFTFGGFDSTKECDKIDPTRVLRFINSEVYRQSSTPWRKKIHYDFAPFFFDVGGDPIGYALYLNEDEWSNVKSYGLNALDRRDFKDWAFYDLSGSPHSDTRYLKEITKLYEIALKYKVSIGTNGFSAGKFCMKNSECKGKCSTKNTFLGLGGKQVCT